MVWWLVNSYFFTQIDGMMISEFLFFTQIDGMMISEFLFFYPDRWYDD